MKLFSVAIGKQYEVEVLRLQNSIPLPIEVFTKDSDKYFKQNEDPLIDGLYHKCNFANYIDNIDDPVIFMDADMFTLIDDPFKDFLVKPDTDIAYIPYKGIWCLPDTIRQTAFDYHGHKINSGFIYFRTLEIAKIVCNQWTYEYLEREKLYDEAKGTSKHEYDEWALMIALSKLNYKIELLNEKWNNWELSHSSLEEILNCDSVFLQSHNHLDILNYK